MSVNNNEDQALSAIAHCERGDERHCGQVSAELSADAMRRTASLDGRRIVILWQAYRCALKAHEVTMSVHANDPLDATWLERLPKVELHVHLEGSIDASTAVALATMNGRDPRDALVLDNGTYPRRYRDFGHFVDVFLATSRQLTSPEALRTVAEAFATSQRQQQVRWTEATFTVMTLVRQGLAPDEIWAAISEGFAAVEGVAIGLIVDTVRELGVEEAQRTVELVAAADAPIVGLGLTGIEGSIAEGELRLLREAADDLNLGLAVHAGETGTARQVWAALDDLGADRIGHGIAAAADEPLMARLSADGTVVEVCPSSNVSLGLVPRLDDHPLSRLAAHQVAVTINSDDPPFFSTTLTQELGHASRIVGWEPHEIIALQQRAAAASFAPDAVVAAVSAELDQFAATLPA